MSIFEHHKTTDAKIQKNLSCVDDLVESGVLWSGLKRGAKPISIASPDAITNVTLLNLFYGVKTNTGPVEGFHENFLLTGEDTDIHYNSKLDKPGTGYNESYTKGESSYTPYIYLKLREMSESADFVEAIQLAVQDQVAVQDQEFSQEECIDIVRSNTDLYIFYLVRCCYENGFESVPFFNRMFQILRAGGFPCGWLGVKPSPETMTEQACAECMQVFYLG